VTYGTHTLGLAPRLAFGATVATGLCGALFNPLGGWLADRFGRKTMILAGLTLLLMAALPCFVAIAALKTLPALVLGSGLLATCLALGTPAINTLLLENLPPLSRSGGMGTTYALAISIFGGTAQFVVAWLIGVTGSPLVPAWYMSGAIIVALAALLALLIRAAA
jgi:MFS transporter, MHS family, citrate/tricarballylate:H+ symporter